MAAITLAHVDKRYANGFVAVRDLSLSVADGELLVLVGPSGSGKSTALRMIAGLEAVTGGRILIGGRDVTDLPPQARDIAMVFQSYALYPHMTVRENLAFGLTIRKQPKALVAERVAAAAASLGITALLDRKPAQLSGGQRQRVALGRAIVREPLAFLFDEPLSNLDARLRVETRAELARLHQRLGATMVYVTHDQIEAMTLGTRVAVMHEGVLQQVAAPMTLYREPANIFVAGFIGSPAMNFVHGRVRRVAGDEWRFESTALTAPIEIGAAGVDDGAEATLGIRPHDLAIVGDQDDDALVRGSVWLVEALGSEQIVHVSAANLPDVAIVVPADQRIAVGSVVNVRAAARSLHLFDATSGARIPATESM
jgi:multiple sugar transport system ATP-binding protein